MSPQLIIFTASIKCCCRFLETVGRPSCSASPHRPKPAGVDLQLSGGVGAIRPLLELDGCVWIFATRLPGLGVDPQSSDGVGRGPAARSAAVSETPQRPAGGASCPASQPLRKPAGGVWSSAAGPLAVRSKRRRDPDTDGYHPRARDTVEPIAQYSPFLVCVPFLCWRESARSAR